MDWPAEPQPAIGKSPVAEGVFMAVSIQAPTGFQASISEVTQRIRRNALLRIPLPLQGLRTHKGVDAACMPWNYGPPELVPHPGCRHFYPITENVEEAP